MGEWFPLWSLASMVWEGREHLGDWICLSLFLHSHILPFHRFLYSWRSVTSIGLKFEHDFYLDISFLAAKEGHQPPYGVSMRVKGAPPTSSPPRASSRVDSTSQNSHIFQKNLRQFLSRLDSVWYRIFCETKNMQQTGIGTGHWINMLVPKIV